jgi:hypothetical protein
LPRVQEQRDENPGAWKQRIGNHETGTMGLEKMGGRETGVDRDHGAGKTSGSGTMRREPWCLENKGIKNHETGTTVAGKNRNHESGTVGKINQPEKMTSYHRGPRTLGGKPFESRTL